MPDPRGDDDRPRSADDAPREARPGDNADKASGAGREQDEGDRDKKDEKPHKGLLLRPILLVSGQDQLIQSDALTALVALYKALGGGWSDASAR